MSATMPARVPFFRWVVVLAAGVVLAGLCHAQTTAPASAPAAATQGHSPPALEQLMATVQWTDEERTILSSVRDRLPQWRETGFFVTLKKARNIKPLDAAALAELDAPAYRSLLAEPQRYRARPIQLDIYVAEVCQLEPGVNFTPNRRWQMTDGPIWRVIGINARANVHFAGEQPIQIYCAFDPLAGLGLGKPARETDDGRLQWTVTREPGKESAKFRIAGLFYKIFPEMDAGDKKRRPRMRDYPIVMAWQITPLAATVGAASPAAGSGPNNSVLTPSSAILAALVILLVVTYFFLRRQTRRSRTSRLAREDYQPLRDVKADHTPSDDDPSGIDPLLRQASQEYRKEKGLDDDAT